MLSKYKWIEEKMREKSQHKEKKHVEKSKSLSNGSNTHVTCKNKIQVLQHYQVKNGIVLVSR